MRIKSVREPQSVIRCPPVWQDVAAGWSTSSLCPWTELSSCLQQGREKYQQLVYWRNSALCCSLLERHIRFHSSWLPRKMCSTGVVYNNPVAHWKSLKGQFLYTSSGIHADSVGDLFLKAAQIKWRWTVLSLLFKVLKIKTCPFINLSVVIHGMLFIQ